jgi:hypothetical protein
LISLPKIIVSVCFIFPLNCASGSDPFITSAGARQAGMAYVSVMNSDLWSSFHNQAGLALNKSFSFGLNYENRFNLKELGTRSAGITIPSGKASLGIIYSHFGYINFRRQLAGIGTGIKLSKNISAGVQVDYFSEKTTGEYSNSKYITFEAGILLIPKENIRVGIHIFNPIPGSLRKNYLPMTLRTGAGITLSKELFAGTEVEITSGSTLILKTGFEYEAAKKIWIRGGYSTCNTSFSFGLGYALKTAMIDFSFVSHERLGITSSVSVIFNLNQK